jgi:uncharacterized protein (DUF2147 family)
VATVAGTDHVLAGSANCSFAALGDKPAKSDHWEGQAYNPTDGRTYSSNISLKSADVLRIEGCVFGGLFCGGED